MVSVQEMKKILRDEYGIESTKDLDKALAEINGIDISIFVTPRNRSNAEDDTKATA